MGKIVEGFTEGYAQGIYANANEAWEQLYAGLNTDGDETAPRGLRIRETLGCNIYIRNPMDNLVYNSFRLASPYYIAQEYFWYLSADLSLESIAKYAGFWKRIANPDGTVNSNYGRYIFVKDETGKTEFEKRVELLKRDPDSRQAVLQLPVTPFLNTKDVTCTLSLQFFVRHGKVHMTTYMRSNDLNKGFCNDIPFFTSLQIMMAKELGYELGWYRHCVGSLHVYEQDFVENAGKDFMIDRSFWHKNIYPVSVAGYDFESDYQILRNRQKEGLSNPVLKYMADNFDNK